MALIPFCNLNNNYIVVGASDGICLWLHFDWRDIEEYAQETRLQGVRFFRGGLGVVEKMCSIHRVLGNLPYKLSAAGGTAMVAKDPSVVLQETQWRQLLA